MFLLSGQKGRDAMQTGCRIGGGASALGYRHPSLSRISLFLQCLAGMADPAARRHVRWTPHAASTAAVLMALDADGPLQGRFEHARACLEDGRCRPGTTYNGLLKALERQQDRVLPIVKTQLRAQVRRRLTRIDPTNPWILLAVDGSKEELPSMRLGCPFPEVIGKGCQSSGCYQSPENAILAAHEADKNIVVWRWSDSPAPPPAYLSQFDTITKDNILESQLKVPTTGWTVYEILPKVGK